MDDPRGRDREHPPDGLMPAVCMECGGDELRDVPRMAIGPIRGRNIAAGEVGTLIGTSKCRVCKGTGWVWATTTR